MVSTTRRKTYRKIAFAFIELGEASDAWKKDETEEKIAEELIDVIFYVSDTSRLACPSFKMDEMFKKKPRKHLVGNISMEKGIIEDRSNVTSSQKNLGLETI